MMLPQRASEVDRRFGPPSSFTRSFIGCHYSRTEFLEGGVRCDPQLSDLRLCAAAMAELRIGENSNQLLFLRRCAPCKLSSVFTADSCIRL